SRSRCSWGRAFRCHGSIRQPASWLVFTPTFDVRRSRPLRCNNPVELGKSLIYRALEQRIRLSARVNKLDGMPVVIVEVAYRGGKQRQLFDSHVMPQPLRVETDVDFDQFL